VCLSALSAVKKGVGESYRALEKRTGVSKSTLQRRATNTTDEKQSLVTFETVRDAVKALRSRFPRRKVIGSWIIAQELAVCRSTVTRFLSSLKKNIPGRLHKPRLYKLGDWSDADWETYSQQGRLQGWM